MRRAPTLMALLAALVALAAHLPALDAGLVYDDREVVAGNPLLEPDGAGDWGRLLTSAWWQGPGRDLLWRPLTLATVAAQRVSGAGARGLHAGNLLLHAGVSILVFLLARRLIRRDGAALAAACLFAAHPVTGEAVTLVVGRADLLAALWMLAALLAGGAAMTAPAPRRRALLAVAGLCAGLAPLSKESGFVLPLLALVTLRPKAAPAGSGEPGARLRAWRARLPALAALTLPALAVLALRVTVLGALMRTAAPALGDNPIAHAPFWAGRLAALRLLAHGGRLALWPAPLSVDYSYAAVTVPPVDAAALVSVVAGLAALFLALRLLARRPAALWGALFFLAAQALTANLIVPIGTVFGERLLYLPLAGLAVTAADLGAAGGDRLARLGRWPGRLPALAAVVAVLVMGGATWRRAAVFTDDLSLWQATVAVAPDSARARYNLGRSLAADGRHDEAAQQYRRALEILPGHLETANNLAASELRLGRPAAALEILDRIAAAHPGSAVVALNRALALHRLGREADARAAFLQGAALDRAAAERMADRGEPWRSWLTAGAVPSPPPAPGGG